MGNITELSQGNLDGLKKQVCECIDHAQAQGYKKGYEKGQNDGHAQGCNTQIEYEKEKIDKAKQEGYDTGYNEGLENARKYINKLYQYGLNELQNYFDETSISDIICCTSIADIIASINLYEEKKKAEEEIKVGDIVKFNKKAHNYDNVKDREYLVLNIFKDTELATILFDNGDTSCADINLLYKTGRHIAEVEQLLDKLKGDK